MNQSRDEKYSCLSEKVSIVRVITSALVIFTFNKTVSNTSKDKKKTMGDWIFHVRHLLSITISNFLLLISFEIMLQMAQLIFYPNKRRETRMSITAFLVALGQNIIRGRIDPSLTW